MHNVVIVSFHGCIKCYFDINVMSLEGYERFK